MGKGFVEYAKILELESLLETLSDSVKQHIDGQYYRKNKGIVD